VDGVAPPDTNGSVGATQYVQIVNTAHCLLQAGILLSLVAHPAATAGRLA
jgi:hypothetical protein